MSRTTHIVDIGGPVYYADHGGEGPPMLLLHGLGGSHLNWESTTPLFARNHHVYAVDLVGFGLTPLAGRRATVRTQRDLVSRFIDEVVGAPTVLMGNSMGGLVGMMTAATRPDLIDRLVLVNPALPLVSADSVSRTTLERLGLPLVPFVGPASVKHFYRTMDPEEQVETTINLLCYDPTRVSAAARGRSVEMVKLRREMEWATEAFTQAIRSTTSVLLRRQRFADRVLHRISAPTLLVHGNADAIVAPASARWAVAERPDWTLRMMSGVGHIPMVEVPDAFVTMVDEWLATAAIG